MEHLRASASVSLPSPHVHSLFAYPTKGTNAISFGLCYRIDLNDTRVRRALHPVTHALIHFCFYN